MNAKHSLAHWMDAGRFIAPTVLGIVISCSASASEPIAMSPETRPEDGFPSDHLIAIFFTVVAEQHVAIGMSPTQVHVAMLGPPDDCLSKDVWIYWSVVPKGRKPGEGYATLLIVFEAGRVKRLLLTDTQATRTLFKKARETAKRKFLP